MVRRVIPTLCPLMHPKVPFRGLYIIRSERLLPWEIFLPTLMGNSISFGTWFAGTVCTGIAYECGRNSKLRAAVPKGLHDLSLIHISEYKFDILQARMRELAYLNKGITISLTDRRIKEEAVSYTHLDVYKRQA